MSRTIYTRVSDGATVSEAEACEANGSVRNGYAVRVPFKTRDSGTWIKPGDTLSFNMALLDSAGVTANLTDAERVFADSAEGREAVTLAKVAYEMGQRHLGESAIPWDASKAHAALRDAAGTKAAHAASVTAMRAAQPALQAAEATAAFLSNRGGHR